MYITSFLISFLGITVYMISSDTHCAITVREMVAEMEQPLMEALVGYLAERPDVTLVGPRTAQRGLRVPVVSFMVAGRASADIAAALQVTLATDP